ncbi:O antigen biosynthesis rhamnosyltransferase rfbN [Klebsiella variicola]|uniref:O antigen biosynthesis rhamnosyltransferase rfbN n=2 Tax=Klebsiella TaxID=570 RepID=A0ABD7P0K2_KLEVA|nr:glycosyltransferase [Klebsiella variicola]BAT24325.1 rhamnosyl transferase [Klebsiella sp. 4349]HBZ7859083.1 glycosyltransferase family 2 protein [Klebsiella variicola subsp. variicola]MBA6175739.1 glycosyltransferase family 2 protein [Klebsiella variicola]MBQ5179131.1 glycosyltransferase family 2 protein [Klebsiella variicola]MCK6047221.1 glycosyltransferase [Klebsiella variicola]
MRACIIIPTYNGGALWERVATSIQKNVSNVRDVLVIDSGSTDNTVVIAKQHNFTVKQIEKKNFNHGGTRNLAFDLHHTNYDIAIFLTQDAIPEPNFVTEICKAFEDPMVVCAYGRQLPHDDANPISMHARYFNYPEISYVVTALDKEKMGMRTVFLSNSFSAYRVSTFSKIGQFPSNTILSEDMFFAAQSIIAGYKVAYVSDAKVKHSHNYSFKEEFKRYFDIGVFHRNESWIRKKFGGAGGEGKKFILSELNYLFKNNPCYIPISMLNNVCKIAGYKLGQYYNYLPKNIVKKISMHKGYWR